MEAEIIAPIPKEVLKAELTDDKRLRMTSKSNNEVYVVTWQDSPNVVREIGRLREIAFRAAGGGTGLDCDLDEFDTMENPYKQLIVWNPDASEIIGGYRYILGPDIKFDNNGQPILATSHMFHFSDNFIKNYMPYTIELGRSFVTLEYQSTRSDNKSIFALDNLWDGLGALAVIMPDCKYFFGKMTMYPSYNRKGRDMILYFLRKHFGDKEDLVIPTKPLELEHDVKEFEKLFSEETFKEDYKILNREVRALGYNIPPLINAYMGLSPTMKMFGTAINYGFGDVEETGILIAVSELYDQKRIRYIDNFAKEHPEYARITSGANKVIYEPKNKKELEDNFDPIK
ncbi:MAG: GNAT family N-acetyltransferase [Bacteroidaceae bacterium]|nr:GNAT family N-acetyltransferase [Bacteroidaceae bacterium]